MDDFYWRTMDPQFRGVVNTSPYFLTSWDLSHLSLAAATEFDNAIIKGAAKKTAVMELADLLDHHSSLGDAAFMAFPVPIWLEFDKVFTDGESAKTKYELGLHMKAFAGKLRSSDHTNYVSLRDGLVKISKYATGTH